MIWSLDEGEDDSTPLQDMHDGEVDSKIRGVVFSTDGTVVSV